MNFINRLFKGEKIECPRCLGKGEVNWDDIKRLNNELRWIPGRCAYCNGTGKVPIKMPLKVSADNAYLTTDLSEQERKSLLNGEEGAINRANEYDLKMNLFIKQIEYLHFVGKMDSYKIADFYLLEESKSENPLKERQELLDYIELIINKRSNKNR